jgi:glucosylceramidase
MITFAAAPEPKSQTLHFFARPLSDSLTFFAFAPCVMALLTLASLACACAAAAAMAPRPDFSGPSRFPRLLAVGGGDIAVIESSQAGSAWTPLPSLSWGPDFSSSVDVTVNSTSVLQEIYGFGSALTDTSAYNAITWMNDTTRAAFVESLWGTTGLGLSIGRITLNSADYSFESFNYDNVTGDYSLEHFDTSLAYDHQRVIPLIRLAMQASVDPIRFFSSPWSPPGWLKGNGNMIDSSTPCLLNDTAGGQSARATWAAYQALWVQSMENAGVPLWGMTPQNEPMAAQPNFESCVYTVDGMVDFVANYLGPAVRGVAPWIKMLAYDHNRLASAEWAAALQANASAFIDGTATHWYDYFSSLGLEQLDQIYSLNPALPILNTEACWLAGLEIDWNRSALYMADIWGGLNHHLNGWVFWNSALLTGDMYPSKKGGPNHDGSQFGDPVLFEYNASGTQALIFQAPYYILGHLSRYARPGSHLITSGGAGVASSYADYEAVRAYAVAKSIAPVSNLTLLSVAFLSQDATTVSVAVANPNDVAVAFKLRDVTGGGAPRAVQTTIPAKAVHTYTFAAA